MSEENKENLEKKKKFSSPEQIKFSKKISVKALPKEENIFTSVPSKPQSESRLKDSEVEKKLGVKALPKEEIKTSPIPSKPQIENITKDSENVKKEVEATSRTKKLTLKLEDIKLNLKQNIDKLKSIDKKITIIPTKKGELIQNTEIEEKIELIKPIKYVSHEKNITDDIVSDSGFDFARELKSLITKKGSNLSLKLCQMFIEELLSSLQQALKLEDLELAADLFVQIEKK